MPSTVCHFEIGTDGTLQQTLQVSAGYSTKAVAVDSADNAWVASCGDSAVYMVEPSGAVRSFRGGGMDTPWGICVDGDDHVWVANFGTLGLGMNYTTGALTQLAGIHPPHGMLTGDPISPVSGYTLPSAGQPVLLNDGQQLYGAGAEPCYCPLMRATSCQIDAAGNVWVVNNWKPSFDTDFPPETGNPGGDGVVIFVGLAKPPRTGSARGA